MPLPSPASLPTGTAGPVPRGRRHRLPEEERVAACDAVRGWPAAGRGRRTDGVWGGRRMEGEGPAAKRDGELVALSGKATAGDASGAGTEARGCRPPTGPILAPGAP